MSVVYSTKTRVRAARAVLGAKDWAAQKAALNHWGVFNPSYVLPIMADECEAAYVDRVFGVLREEVMCWYLSHLEARIETLETGDGGRLGDHR